MSEMRVMMMAPWEVEALRAGRKRQLCRPITPQPLVAPHPAGHSILYYPYEVFLWQGRASSPTLLEEACPYGRVGERLHVQETSGRLAGLSLRVEGVRAEPLHMIDVDDALAQGIGAWPADDRVAGLGPREWFLAWWAGAYAATEFAAARDPWVWVLDVRRWTIEDTINEAADEEYGEND
jgi:hypothetical protein